MWENSKYIYELKDIGIGCGKKTIKCKQKIPEE